MSDPNPNNPVNSSIMVGKVSSRLSKRTGLNLALVLIVVIACVGGYLYYNHHYQATKSVPADKRTYSSLSSYTIKGTAAGQGMSFKLPTDFIKQTYKTKTPPGQLSFLQRSSKTKSSDKDHVINQPVSVAIGGAFASTSAYLHNAPSAASLKATNDSLKAADKQFLATQTKLATVLINTHFVGEKISVQSLKAFTNSSIKSGAWVADFTVSNNQSKPIFGGRLVYDATAKSVYNFLVYAADYNWNTATNQATWNQVVASLKVDE